MAQVGFLLLDEGRTITAQNDSGTTAITAGDPVYFTTNNDAFGSTAASVRANYAYSDLQVKSLVCSNTGYKTPAGIAISDASVAGGTGDGEVTVALEGIFFHPVNADTEAGDAVIFDKATSQKLDILAVGSTTLANAAKEAVQWKVGRALTGGSADGKYVMWKLSL
jgi:hypothetical protein